MNVGEQFAIELGRVNRQWRKRLDERLKESGLTQARWLVLLHLSRTGPLSQRDLAELIGVDGPTLVRVLDKLEHRKELLAQVDDDELRAAWKVLKDIGDRLESL